MKSLGATLAFTAERNKALLDAYRYHIKNTSFIRLYNIGSKIVNSPAPRFWVSEERATAVVSALFRGNNILECMRPSKREMFQEIFNRVSIIKSKSPDMPLSKIVAMVVNAPAPKFYMEVSSVIELLFKIRRGVYKCK